MKSSDEIINNIKNYSIKELRSELLVKCAENEDLINTIKVLKRRMSIVSSGVIRSCARFVEDEDKPECIFALDKNLFKDLFKEVKNE